MAAPFELDAGVSRLQPQYRSISRLKPGGFWLWPTTWPGIRLRLVSEATERFSENLGYYFEKSGMSQENLAARAEIHRTQAGDLLRPKDAPQPRLETIVRLAGALSVSPCDLLEGITFEPAEQTGKFKLSPPKRKK